MSLVEWVMLFAFFISSACIFAVFIGYPLTLYVFSRVRAGKQNFKGKGPKPSISLLVVFRNAESLIQNKILNSFELDYPREKIELVLISDGTTDNSLNLIKEHTDSSIRLFHFKEHMGKIDCLNFGVKQCNGQVIVFSDADALLDRMSLRILSNYFSDDSIGGVCGQRVVLEDTSNIKSGQVKYIKWDSMIKSLEVKSGMSVTSNDGKIYAIRRELFVPVPQGVTDDAYISLSVVLQNRLFVFDPDALAYIKLPSRSARHELIRRIRIVSTSLNGLKINKKLFSPSHSGCFSIGLFINKILRRLLPIALIICFFTSFKMAVEGMAFAGSVFWFQVSGYFISLLYPVFCVKWISRRVPGRYLKKISAMGFFFCLGMLGTLLGTLIFLSGKKIIKWDPVKD